MPAVYDTEQQSLKPQKEESLLEVCLRENVPINHSCEGMGSCGTCRVIITQGTVFLPPRNMIEKEMADDRGFSETERLACQLPADVDCHFVLPED
ncbi:MAG: 2Fe-2S iron-sulfur cluster-binding protein [Pseudomonadota bacterium]